MTEPIRVIRLDNPPVNGLSHPLRVRLAADLDQAMADPAVKAVVLIGAGRYFCGGADIREFNTPAAGAEPTTYAVIQRVAGLPKPVVAAIHGAALGGGLELALACHYRVADAAAVVGLPEVKLGILPGAGGTQRLPRLAGVAAALDMILSARQVGAREALGMGVLDAVYESDLEASAIAFASSVADRPLAPRSLALRQPPREGADAILAAARGKASRDARGLKAPGYIIDCVEKSVTLPLDEGLRFEREKFLELLGGAESKALRHLFFAEREAAKSAPEGAQERRIDRVGVVGGGTMGTGIAMAFANAGLPVVLVETDQGKLDKALQTIRRQYEATASKGKLTAGQVEERLARIHGGTDLEAVAGCDVVIEAVFEDMEVKRSVFEQLDRIARPGAILATNTSRLDVDAIAAATSRPADVVGLHFFSPAHVMRLLEVVRGRATSPDALLTAMRLAKRIGKLAVVVGVCEGFVGNRMVSPYAREAQFLLEEGATPRQVDQALERFGMAMGPLRMGDMAGLDISWAARKRLAATRDPKLRYCRIADRICEAGRLGQKTGAGFYRYEPGSRTPVPDPEIDALIEACARESGIVRRAVPDEEIVERTIYALVNEGAKILAEGIAQRASDVDVIYVNGYGFPAARGGPMFYADTVGLAKVLDRIREFEERHGELWKPAPLLEELVQRGEPLSSYRK